MTSIKWNDSNSAEIAAFNNKLLKSINTSGKPIHPVYEMSINFCERGGGLDEISEVRKYKSLTDYITCNEEMVFEGGIFAESGGSYDFANCSEILPDVQKERNSILANVFKYESDADKKEFLKEFDSLVNIVKTQDYIMVTYVISADNSWLVIKKEDYEILNSFKVFEDEDDCYTWLEKVLEAI